MATGPLIECVPNFSEGRDSDIIEAIVEAARGIDGCKVIGAEADADYNRTVLTLAGQPEPVAEAAFRVISTAADLIDMRRHSGEHPRIGAVDVCPFVPLVGSDQVECAETARRLGQRVADKLGLPVYLYGHAAGSKDRESLAALRRGQYEGLRDRMEGKDSLHDDSTRLPDLGPLEWNETVARFGAVVIGARPVLVAFNVNLDETDARVARICGSIIRSSGRLVEAPSGSKMRVPGMLEGVQGMGVRLDSHGISQVSMNLQNVAVTDMHIAYECVRSIASDHGVEVIGSELVGLAPLTSFLAAGRWFSRDSESHDEGKLVELAIEGLGLSRLGPFNPDERIIEWAANT